MRITSFVTILSRELIPNSCYFYRGKAMKRIVEKVVATTLAVCAASVCWGYPTAKEIEDAQPLVIELMKPAMRGYDADAASAAVAFAKNAETEAEKFLLLRGAVNLYARAGEDAKAAKVFIAMLATVKDIPSTEQERILLSAGRALSKQKPDPVWILSLYRKVRSQIVSEQEAKAALAELAKSPKSAAGNLRMGNSYAILGNWTKALKHLGESSGEIAQLARKEAGGKVTDEKLADGWWKEADEAAVAEVKAAYRAHAAALYSKALEEGSLTGLRKTLAERRIVEARQSRIGYKASRDDTRYCVIDLSPGPDAKQYPMRFLATPPSSWTEKNGWPDEYKTTKLVLRRIEAGSFTMGAEGKTPDASHIVTLTKPFYIGVFEVTQKQWQLVTGNNPSHFKGEMRPVEEVTYDMIRGSSEGAKWPISTFVDPDSFLDKLRTRTGLEFDLPTEAQWEYACKAGTKTKYSYGDNVDESYMWYGENSSHVTHDVGTKKPNPWGLYDMHGNVREWCLDWRDDYAYGVDPTGPSSGSDRVLRSGGQNSESRYCTSATRSGDKPSMNRSSHGLRLICPLSE